jgi:glycerophosphoryl diester phosphodiesterase
MVTWALPGKTKPYLMAHRGNSARCPENTLAAFRQALADGADILETDLHLTADGVFVCIHDATVDRTTDGCGVVADMTLDQIKTLSASYGRPGFEAEQVPALQELMTLLPPDAALALELKTDRFLQPDVCHRLADKLEAGGIHTRVAILSFSMARLRAVQQVAPDIPTGLITLKNPLPTPDATLLGPLWPLLVVNPLYVWWAHRQGKLVCPLDVNPDSRVWLYRRLGCDAIMTNDPSTTARILYNRD